MYAGKGITKQSLKYAMKVVRIRVGVRGEVRVKDDGLKDIFIVCLRIETHNASTDNAQPA